MRIFSISKKTTLHRGLVALLCTVGAWTVAYFFANMFQCRQNIASVWGSPNELATNCPNTEDYDVSLSITNFIIDVVIMVIPIPLVRP